MKIQTIEKILTFIMLIVISLSNISLKQYESLEQKMPELIFERRSAIDLVEYTPNLQKIIFVTPWNEIGYDYVLKYAKKFDYVSPCWYDLVLKKQHILIENSKQFDLNFIRKIKAANPKIKILPRVYISSNEKILLQHIGSIDSNLKQTIHSISSLINNQQVDGLVWDTSFNSLIRTQSNLQLNQLLIKIVNSVKLNLKSDKLLFYLRESPGKQVQANQLFFVLNVDAVLIKSYNPTMPYVDQIKNTIQWVRGIVIQQRPKYFIILPFFSRRRNQGISTRQVQRAIQNEKLQKAQITNAKLCKFKQMKTKSISQVPCYTFFKNVFQLIEQSHIKLGAGFWQAGSGIQNQFLFL